MAKVITFSRTFPSYHPRKGEPTLFAEKILLQQGLLHLEAFGYQYHKILKDLNPSCPGFIISDYCNSVVNTRNLCGDSVLDIGFKHHTIRARHRFKQGEYISPRVWSGKPYNSKQIIIAPPIKIIKSWDFYLLPVKEMGDINIYGFINEQLVDPKTSEGLASNDGLEIDDFESWFCPEGMKIKVMQKVFDGQIICWNESIEY